MRAFARAAIVVAGVFGGSGLVAEAGVVSTWIGPSAGNWSEPTNWDPTGVPSGQVSIPPARRAITVTLDVNASFTSLAIGTGNTLVQLNDRDMTVNGSVTNNGVWSVNSGGNDTDLYLNQPVVAFDGNGTLQLSNAGQNRILSIGAIRTLQNGMNHTISGSGQIGFDNTYLDNDGTVEAVGSTGLFVDLREDAPSQNDGLMVGRSGSTLTLWTSWIDNGDGIVRADDGGTVLMRFGTLVGGHLETQGSGAISTTSEQTTFVDVTVDGSMVQPNDADSAVVGTITNNATWSLNSAGNDTDLRLNSETVTFAGPGSLVLSNNSQNRIYSIGAIRTFLNATTHTITGSGQFGLDNTYLDNDGTVEAVGSTGLFVDLREDAPSQNDGLMVARSGSTLTLWASWLDNGDGIVRADDGGTVLTRFGTLVGGHLETVGSGTISTTTEPTTFVDVTVDGSMVQPNDADSAVVGTITNNATWSLNSAGNDTDLRLNSETVTFAGPGSLVLSNNSQNRIYSIGAIRTLLNASTHTISGSGQLGADLAYVDNDGTVEAVGSTGLFVDLREDAPSQNDGLMVARSGSTMTFYSSWLDNGDGTIRADDGGTVLMRFGTLVGGHLETGGSGAISTTSEPTTFVDVTVDGSMVQPNDADTVVVGTVTNNGTWSMNSGGNDTDLRLNSETVTFTGPGSLVLTDSGQNRIYSVNLPRTLVNSADHTIAAAGGQLGLDNTLIVNEGTIESDGAVGLFIDPWGNSFGMRNEGTMHCMGTGGIRVYFGGFENQASVLIDPGSAFTRDTGYLQTAGETRVHGTLSNINGGSIVIGGGELTGDGVVSGNVVVDGGTVAPTAALTDISIGSLDVQGAYSQTGNGAYAVELALDGNDLIAVTGAATLAGFLNIALDDGFVPALGQEFTILTAASVSGRFGCVEYDALPVGYFRVQYSPTDVKLVVVSTPPNPADFNGDGVVGAADLAILLGAWGIPGCGGDACCPPDLNGDGDVGPTDLAILLGAWS